jgi:glycosyl transferase family 2
MPLAYGVCVGSWDRFNQYVVPRTQGREVVGISGQTSIAVAYNKILEAFQGYMEPNGGARGLVLLHDDLEILDQTKAEAAILEAFQDPDVALVGVAGGDARSGLAWWNIDPIGHQLTDSMNIDFGKHAGDVTLLEGSLLAFSPWAVERLGFDEDYRGFHGYDEIAMQAIKAGKRVVVVDIDTHHHSTLGFDSLDSHAQWHKADQRFREKWGL